MIMDPFPPGMPQYATPPPPVKEPSRRGRRKINIEYIPDKSRRQITFSKRKAGIMKKAYELATLTGTQVLLLVASESGHVYTFATPKLQPLITEQEGKNLIQNCLNAPSTNPEPENLHEQESPPSGLNIHTYAHKRELEEEDDEEPDPLPRTPLKTEHKIPDFAPQNSYPLVNAPFATGNSYLNQHHLYGRQVGPIPGSIASPLASLPNIQGHQSNSYVPASHHQLGPSFPYGYSSQPPQYGTGNYLMRPPGMYLSSPLDMVHSGSLQGFGHNDSDHGLRRQDDEEEDEDEGDDED